MIIYYISADWCGPCKMFKPIVQQVSSELNVPINYVNADYDVAITQKYKITAVPTIIIAGHDGSEKYRHSGAMSKQQLTDAINTFR